MNHRATTAGDRPAERRCPSRRRGRLLPAALAIALLAGSGCTPTQWMKWQNRQTNVYLDRAWDRALPGTPAEKLRLDAFRAADTENWSQTVKLDLRQALALAAKHNRDYQTSKETLYSSAMTVWLEAHRWGWNVTNSLNGLLARDLGEPSTSLQGDGTLGLGRPLISGGRLTTSIALDTVRFLSGEGTTSISSLADVTLTQPLLQGFGPLVARENLTQAERNLIYALRTYVRNRKSLLLQVADRYYSVLSAMDSLEIARRNLETLQVSRERAEAMAEAGRLPPFQVDQARQDELSAQASVVLREQSYEASRDQLKQVLSLPLTADVEVDRDDLRRLADANLPLPPGSLAEACQRALANRLDFATVKDEMDDAERHLKIAANGVLPKVDLTLKARATGPTDEHVRGPNWTGGTYSAGLSAQLPFDKTAEANAYRRAMLSRDQSQRNVAATRDQILAGLRTDWRALQAAEQNYRIQRLSVTLAERRIESTEMLFQAGRIEIRYVLDARTALINARNALTQALVTHRLSWLRLLYDVEMLPTDPETLWSSALEMPAATQTP